MQPLHHLIINVGDRIILMANQPLKERWAAFDTRTKWMAVGVVALIAVSVGISLVNVRDVFPPGAAGNSGAKCARRSGRWREDLPRRGADPLRDGRHPLRRSAHGRALEPRVPMGGGGRRLVRARILGRWVRRVQRRHRHCSHR